MNKNSSPKYTCQDCGYSTKKKLASIACPACDSYNFSSNKGKDNNDSNTQLYGKLRLTALLLLWGVLITLIYNKLYN